MNLPIAPLVAIVLGALAALGVAAMPVSGLESLVMGSGLPAILPAAEPPLGLTARAVAALASGGFAALFAWLAAFILVGSRSVTLGRALEPAAAFDDEDLPMPVLRRADAHPDAPPRPPLLATRDLGTPFLNVRAAEALVEEDAPEEDPGLPLPRDLEQPLSAFDPAAIRAVPMPPPVKLPPARRVAQPVLAPNERLEVFELRPPVPAPPPAAEPIARPETEASVLALLERLEKGVVRRSLARKTATPKQVERGLEDALATLRNMARQA